MSEIIMICEEINQISFGPCLYNWNTTDNALEILYVSKSKAKSLFPENLLNYYHYWEIQGDEGNSSDTIVGISNSYKSNNRGKTNSQQAQYWEYTNICQFQSDEIKIYGKKDKILQLLNGHFLLNNEINNCDKINAVEIKLDITYNSCSDRICIENSIDQKIVQINFYRHLFADGRIHRIIKGDLKGLIFTKENLGVLFDNLKNEPKIIDSFELVYQNRIVHKFFNQNNRLSEKTGDFWDNCSDREYLEFKKWYSSNLKKNNAAANNA